MRVKKLQMIDPGFCGKVNVYIIVKVYGSVNPETGFSYTEMEYEYAKEKDIPVLVFAIDDSAVLPKEEVEQDTDKIEKLRLFREKAITNRLTGIWKTNDELTENLLLPSYVQ